jgi:undecaprenyl-diphosphatase
MIGNQATGGVLLLITRGASLFTVFFNKTTKVEPLLDEKSKLFPVITGLVKGVAIIPGFSRLDSTVFVLSLGQLSPPQILRISYLMSVPVVLASFVYLLFTDPVLTEGLQGLVSSFLVGIVSLALVMK